MIFSFLTGAAALNEQGIFYVYVLFRPWNGEPCYVGKGSGERILYHHFSRNRPRNTPLGNIMKRAEREGTRVPAVKVREGLRESDAMAIEIALIAVIGRKLFGGPLVNLTDGGEGTSGHVHSAEARARISAAFKGKKRPPEVVEKMRRARMGYRPTVEAIEKTAAAKRGRTSYTPSAEVRAKISNSLKGIKFTEERLRNMSRGQLASPAKKRIADQLRGVPLAAETRAKISAAKIGKKQTEAQRATTRAAMLVVWAQRKATKSMQQGMGNANV